MGTRKRHGGGKGTSDKTGKSSKRGHRKRRSQSELHLLSSSNMDSSKTDLPETETADAGPKLKQQRYANQVPGSKLMLLLFVMGFTIFLGLSAGIYFYKIGDFSKVTDMLQAKTVPFIEILSEEQAAPFSKQEDDDRLDVHVPIKLHPHGDSTENGKNLQPAEELEDFDGFDTATTSLRKSGTKPVNIDADVSVNSAYIELENFKRDEKVTEVNSHVHTGKGENVDTKTQETEAFKEMQGVDVKVQLLQTFSESNINTKKDSQNIEIHSDSEEKFETNIGDFIANKEHLDGSNEKFKESVAGIQSMRENDGKENVTGNKNKEFQVEDDVPHYSHELLQERYPDKAEVVVDDVAKRKPLVSSKEPLNLTNSLPDIQTRNQPYEKTDITNDSDFEIRKELDIADSLVEKERPTDALIKYQALQEKNPFSPRAQYGVAWALDVVSELEQSNQYLEMCIAEYTRVLNLPNVPKELMLKAGKRAADRQSFRGWGGRAIKTIRFLLDMFPEELALWNELGVQNLMFGRNEDGRNAFQQVLNQDSDNGFALAHLGFIIKTHDRDVEKAIPYLQAGIDSNEPGTQDGRFYFHLGDALQRLGRGAEAYRIYEQGSKKGLFRSAYQRSLYNVDVLTARPWWTAEQTGNKKQLQVLQDNWMVIRNEGMAQFDQNNGVFVMEDEDLRDQGDWKQFTLFAQGRKDVKNCAKVQKTCALVEQFAEAAGCKRGQVKYSDMEPGTHVWPHCGPTNCRIRAHLGLVVPSGTSIRVANETRTWQEGNFIIFDDSFEHEVWHNGTSLRMVLIVDMWHPELTTFEKRTLSPI